MNAIRISEGPLEHMLETMFMIFNSQYNKGYSIPLKSDI